MGVLPTVGQDDGYRAHGRVSPQFVQDNRSSTSLEHISCADGGPHSLLVHLLCGRQRASLYCQSPSAALMSVHLPRSPGATWLPGYDRVTVAAVNLVIVILAIVGLAMLAGFVRRMGRRTVRSTLLERQALDARAPILFLRAFGDEQVALPPPRLPLLGYFYDVGNRQTSLDVMLLEEGTDYGPVVALGNPKDPVPPYGAARGYFADESWQDAVRRLAHDSAALVICLDDTDGIWWEVAHIRERGLAAKTLLLLHPKFRATSDTGDFLATAIERLGVKEQVDIASATPLASGSSQAAYCTIGFFLGPDGTWQVGLSRAGSRIGYLLMLRWFLRTRLTMRSEFSASCRSAMPARAPASAPCPSHPPAGAARSLKSAHIGHDSGRSGSSEQLTPNARPSRSPRRQR
jgi:hypothetical protein